MHQTFLFKQIRNVTWTFLVLSYSSFWLVIQPPSLLWLVLPGWCPNPSHRAEIAAEDCWWPDDCSMQSSAVSAACRTLRTGHCSTHNLAAPDSHTLHSINTAMTYLLAVLAVSINIIVSAHKGVADFVYMECLKWKYQGESRNTTLFPCRCCIVSWNMRLETEHFIVCARGCVIYSWLCVSSSSKYSRCANLRQAWAWQPSAVSHPDQGARLWLADVGQCRPLIGPRDRPLPPLSQVSARSELTAQIQTTDWVEFLCRCICKVLQWRLGLELQWSKWQTAVIVVSRAERPAECADQSGDSAVFICLTDRQHGPSPSSDKTQC